MRSKLTVFVHHIHDISESVNVATLGSSDMASITTSKVYQSSAAMVVGVKSVLTTLKFCAVASGTKLLGQKSLLT